jgi:DMSO/TMAO reductase YedYZ molybdopterin-dependent catalytic subunit
LINRAADLEVLLALRAETPTVDIHCVTARSKLDTTWTGVWASDLIERDSHALAAAARIRRNVTDARQNLAPAQATARDRGLSGLSSGSDQL